MIWVVYGLLSAGFRGGKSVYDKYLISGETLSSYRLGFITFTATFLCTLPFVFMFGEQNSITNMDFLKATFANISIISLTFFLNFIALKKHDASLVEGIKSFEPIFAGLVGFFILGEVLSLYGIIGMLIICAGGIILQKSRLKEDMQVLLRHSPWIVLCGYMILSSFATVFSKIALLEGGVFIYLTTRYFVMCIIFGSLMLWMERNIETKTLFKIRHVGSGVLLAGNVIFEMLALQIANVAYVESLRKFAIFFTLTFESWFMKNKWNTLRLVACLVLFIGAVLIGVLG